MSDESNFEQYTCPECRAGHVSLRHIVYYTYANGQLITVPDFPAWICDVCGMREYDQRALNWLKIILDPSAGHKARGARPRTQPPAAAPIQPDL